MNKGRLHKQPALLFSWQLRYIPCMNQYMTGSDYSKDTLRWLTKSNDANDIPAMESLQNEIIKNGDAAFAYFFATDYGYKTYLMQKVILDEGDAKYAYAFAQTIKNADIKALQNVVIESKKIKYITHFACGRS